MAKVTLLWPDWLPCAYSILDETLDRPIQRKNNCRHGASKECRPQVSQNLALLSTPWMSRATRSHRTATNLTYRPPSNDINHYANGQRTLICRVKTYQASATYYIQNVEKLMNECAVPRVGGFSTANKWPTQAASYPLPNANDIAFGRSHSSVIFIQTPPLTILARTYSYILTRLFLLLLILLLLRNNNFQPIQNAVYLVWGEIIASARNTLPIVCWKPVCLWFLSNGLKEKSRIRNACAVAWYGVHRLRRVEAG